MAKSVRGKKSSKRRSTTLTGFSALRVQRTWRSAKQQFDLLESVVQVSPQRLEAGLGDQTRIGPFLKYGDSHEIRTFALAALAVADASQEDGYSPQWDSLVQVIRHLLRRRLALSDEHWRVLLNCPALLRRAEDVRAVVPGLLTTIERMAGSGGVPQAHAEQFRTWRQQVEKWLDRADKSDAPIFARLDKLVSATVSDRLAVDGGWADRVRSDLAAMPAGRRASWEDLLRHCGAIPVSTWELSEEVRDRLSALIFAPNNDPDHAAENYERECRKAELMLAPTDDWSASARGRLDSIGREAFTSRLLEWLRVLPQSKPGNLSKETINREVLRGLIWCCADLSDLSVTRALGQASRFLYESRSSLGAACIFVLSRLSSREAAAELIQLAETLQFKSHKSLALVAFDQLCERLGFDASELQQSAGPTMGLSPAGERRETIGKYTAVLSVRDGVTLTWSTADGKMLKSTPAAAAKLNPDLVEELKGACDEVRRAIRRGLTGLERGYLDERRWTPDEWTQCLWDHPVYAQAARRFIWRFERGGERVAGAWDGSMLASRDGTPIDPAAFQRVTLWHPLGNGTEDALAWRQWVETHEVTQPFKQAHREVYVLTDAERRTRVYSNRFASHIIRQSQFRALAKSRQWKADYLGAWDGDRGTAHLDFPRAKVRAEFWTAPGPESPDDRLHPGYALVSTDQVRFYARGERDPMPLEDVPPLVFSEAMRDVDLFVGVASVGNDPTWQDGGPQGHFRQYWESYSFGDLGATAQTRKAVLERIVPRLKIASRCSFDDKFLIVRGDLRTYKIHLGSGNILMTPNDQYLCIVPARGAAAKGLTESVYLPFDGDERLSIILSKALMLADDVKIEDASIVSQITRK